MIGGVGLNYQEYLNDLLEMLHNDSVINDTNMEEEFLNYTLGMLTDFNEIEDPIRFRFGEKRCSGQRIMRSDGYYFDEAEHSLILFISDFQKSYPTQNFTMSRVDELYWRMYYFLDEACNGNIEEYFDKEDDVIKMTRLIRNRINAVGEDPRFVLKIKFYIITNKALDTNMLDKNLMNTTTRKSKKPKKNVKTIKKIKKQDFNEKPLEINLWPLERFYEMETSNNNDPIIIDLQEDFQCKGIPCIKGNIGENLGYDAYIAIIPGKLLADIYIEYGSRILEENVRAFLGTSNTKGVNGGIKRTINNEPAKFFAFNNGIATTAADIDVEEIDGEFLITRIFNLQVINGGQTTATLAEAVLKKTNINLSGIYVPMKLTVIEDRETENEEGVRFYDEMVQSIAKYANSQNKVTSADLFSNDPFHRWMAKLSVKHFAPPARFAIPTGWYYERSRRKYQQEQVKLRGEELNRFLKKFPLDQIINKEQLAMYLTTISCKPHIVSKGKNWVMKEFGTEIENDYKTNKAGFNDVYFRKCICAAIIFRTVDKYLENNKKDPNFWYNVGGYKVNIVPYSISKIISCIPEGYTLNWNKIWQMQAVSQIFKNEIEVVTKLTNDFFCDNPGVIVPEFCKKEDTWKSYRDTYKYKLSEDFINELIPVSLFNEEEKSAEKDKKDTDDLVLITRIIEMGPEYWAKLLEIGTGRNYLGYVDQAYLKQAIDFTRKGIIPCSSSGKVPFKVMTMAKSILTVEEKLEVEGIINSTDKDNNDNLNDVVKLVITDYKMK